MPKWLASWLYHTLYAVRSTITAAVELLVCFGHCFFYRSYYLILHFCWL